MSAKNTQILREQAYDAFFFRKSMRMPIQGETLTTAKGSVWFVEAVNGTDPDDINEPDYDPAFFVVDMVVSAGPQATIGVNIQLDNTAFEQFCKDEGVVLA